MRILFLIDSLNAGGKERRLTELLKRLVTEDVEFELVLMNKNIHYKVVFDLCIKIHYIIRKAKKDITVFYKFYKICKIFRPDIIHCWDSMSAVYIVPICKILNIKLINGMVVDTPTKRNIFNKSWLRSRLTFPFSDIIVGNSNSGLEAYRAPKYKSVCIYNGIDISRFNNLADPFTVRKELLKISDKKVFIIGMVAAFEKRKDYQTLLDAALIILSEKDNIRFVFVGDGSEFSNIKDKIPEFLLDKIVLTGRRSDVESIVNIFDIGVLLTNSKVHGEGISNSILEYMALGKPVIASKGGGTNEIIIDEVNGYLINPGEVEEVIDKIYNLHNDFQLRRKMGLAAKEKVKNDFSIEKMVGNYVKLYKTLTI